MHALRLFTALLISAIMMSSRPAQQTGLIETVNEDMDDGDAESHSGKGGCVGINEVTNNPTRAGKQAFKHIVKNCAERAEIAMSKTVIGKSYWLGWSLYIPPEYEETSKGNIFAQWAAYPDKETTEFPCRGVGHKLELVDGWLEYDLQGSDRQDGNGGGFCKKIRIAEFNSDLKGKWIDFVQHGKWTGNEDGFLRVWMKVGDGTFRQALNYEGVTWWNDETHGPYFKMGLYTGDPGWKGRSPAIVYTDEYRLGDETCSCKDVAPDPSACTF